MPTVEKYPEKQAVHADEPEGAYFPAAQVAQVDAATAAAYFPTSQLVHEATLPLEYFPISQFEQDKDPAKE